MLPKSRFARDVALLLALMGAASAGCKDEPSERRAPPPPEPVAATCGTSGRLNDATNVELLPKKVAGFCIDPAGSDQGYGAGAKQPLEGICELYDGECEIYLRHGIERAVEARYVDGDGSGATIGLQLSRYASAELAYAMFTKRAVGDDDPARGDAPKPMAAGGAAALGMGNAYLWRGVHLAELTYNDARASAEQVDARGRDLLPRLADALANALPGALELPPSARALPSEGRVALGVRFLATDVLDIKGAGAGAFGYYRDEAVRWRVLAKVEASEAHAKAAFETLVGGTGVAEKGLGERAARLELGTPKMEWLIAQKGNRVFGVGDESRVLREGMTQAEHARICLDAETKRKKLAVLLASP
ncbi:MAG: hypothetical protein EXR75_03775 [Myxococcales bacterium]|nr:hypothetical protein [Myxococcales bacterium]